jgi:hypothetical protein
MSAEVKRFRRKMTVQSRTPAEQATWVRADRISIRLQENARNAGLIAWEFGGTNSFLASSYFNWTASRAHPYGSVSGPRRH